MNTFDKAVFLIVRRSYYRHVFVQGVARNIAARKARKIGLAK